MKPNLYPLTFTPIYKYPIWAGNKIRTVLGKDYPAASCGETWEISTVRDNVSVVDKGELSGRDLVGIIEEYGSLLLGSKVYEKYGTSFPLLIKFISSADDLSIQVHPDDDYATSHGKERGKAEMWYVIDADESSQLISGFCEKINRNQYLEAFSNGRLLDILQRVDVERGQCFYLPPGRVHSIGRGILLLEIQQSSDVTYRIYDFDRVDASTGKPRALHVEQALETMNFDDDTPATMSYKTIENEISTMVHCPFFSTDMIYATSRMMINNDGGESFVVLSCVEGTYTLSCDGYSRDFVVGDCVLVPACIDKIEIIPHEGGTKILSSRSV